MMQGSQEARIGGSRRGLSKRPAGWRSLLPNCPANTIVNMYSNVCVPLCNSGATLSGLPERDLATRVGTCRLARKSAVPVHIHPRRFVPQLGALLLSVTSLPYPRLSLSLIFAFPSSGSTSSLRSKKSNEGRQASQAVQAVALLLECSPDSSPRHCPQARRPRRRCCCCSRAHHPRPSPT